MQNNFFDDIDVLKIVAAGGSLQEYLETGKAPLLSKILAEKKLTDAIEAELKEAVSGWKSTWSNA